ncbi:SDR family NAD(P)-dependent oxidoreductase [Flavobacteriaceae bacterium M23B6Z8]
MHTNDHKNSLSKIQIQQRLIRSLAAALYLDVSEIDPEQSFIDLGLDSIVGVEWIKTVNKDFNLALSSTKVYDYSTISKLATYMLKELEGKEVSLPKEEPLIVQKKIEVSSQPQPQPVQKPTANFNTNVLTSFPTLTRKPRQKTVNVSDVNIEREKIAIVGMSGRYPQAPNLEQYWENLKKGKNSVVEVPPSRWDVEKYYDPDPTKPGKVYSKWLGMLEDADRFDPLFFQISPAEAEAMDPQHRLFLEESYKAFEDAGYARNALSDKKCGVYMGIMSNDYSYLLSKDTSGNVNTTANSFAIGAARISYFMNLKGPAIPFDTACSSSLVAIHTACQSLLNGEIDMALAGGVSLYLIPESYIGMCQAGMLSPEGQCKTFDDSANGFVPGEGAGTVVLKRLKDAERDNDHIYGVIIGSGINQDGKTNGITAPSVNSQIELERDIYSRYQIDPETISYIEAHGTGTKLGDPIELEALSTVFGEKTSRKNFCAIGSVKSNIGHTSGAAGVASLQKVLLCMQNKTLVPTLNVKKENNIFDFKKSPFYISRERKEWNNPSHIDSPLRRAGISSFGFSGTNAHLVVEEYPQKKKESQNKAASEVIIPLSARTEEQLRQKATDLLNYLSKNVSASMNLVDMAFTLQVGREEMKERLAIIVSSTNELTKILDAYLKGDKGIENLYVGQAIPNKDTLNFFETEAEFDKLVRKWIWDKNFEKLVELWIKGFELDWNLLYEGLEPYRVNLPTYPFAKERYWPEISEDIQLEKKIKETNVQTVTVPAAQALPTKSQYYTKWKKQPLSDVKEKKEASPDGVLLLMGEISGLFNAWTSLHSDESSKVISVVYGSTFKETSPHHFELNPEKETDFQQLVETLEAQQLLPANILHQPVKQASEERDVTKNLNESVYAIFHLCKALMKLKDQKPLKILSIFEKTDTTDSCVNEALGGFYKTLTLENPKYKGKIIQFESEEQKGIFSETEKLSISLRELADNDWHLNEVKYTATEKPEDALRFVSVLDSFLPTKDQSNQLPIKQGGVYIISGGIGGLGYLFTEYLAKTFQCKLVLFGRSPLKKEQEKKLHSLKELKGEAIYVQADVTKLEDVKAVVKAAKDKFSQINGIIHSAGTSKDSFILKKSKEEMQQVIDPKVIGTINLDLATKDENLDLFVLFSSIAAVLGNLGQSDYAFANRFLDAFAENRSEQTKRQLRTGKTLSINWPYWEEGGFKLPENEIAQGKEFLGIYPIHTSTGLAYFEDFLRVDHAQAIALYGEKEKIESYIKKDSPETPLQKTMRPASFDNAFLLEKTEAYVKEVIGNEIKLDPDRMDPEEQFDVFGIDSIIIGRINVALEKDLGPLSKTLLYEHPTIKELATYLHVEAKQALIDLFAIPEAIVQESTIESSATTNRPMTDLQKTKENTFAANEPIAIIGVHGKYPQSEDLDAYWDHLKKGKDLIGLVPENRWDYKEFYDQDPEKAAEGKIYSKWGGFVNDVDKFDPTFFNIPKEEALMMDPQERLFLESVWATLEDAGYTKNSLRSKYSKGKGSDVGVFVGVTTYTYNLLATDAWNEGNYLNSSAMPWSIANRVSYMMDFQGPSMPIDTACSSSLVSIHLACESLRKQECQVAIAGGVNLYLHHSKYHSLCKKRMIASGSKNYSFGAGDDGFVPGEGVGSVMLKPLSKAIEDQDHIYAVIKGSTFGHSGASNGYSAPNPNSQSALIDETLKRANVHPETIGYVEGHGTGTQLGDSLEILSLTNAFKKQEAVRKQFCPVGSVKANIGHTESAAGIAGITKILLQLKHQQLVPTIHSEEVNPNIDFESSPFYLQHALSPWNRLPNVPRRALINSFGAGGVNSCMVLEEYIAKDVVTEPSRKIPHLILLSAKSKDRLVAYANRLLEFLGENRNIDLADLAFTLQMGRESMSERLAIISSSVPELLGELKKWKENAPSEHIFELSSETQVSRKKLPKYEDSYLNFLLAERNLSEIARVWTEGVKIDWAQLYSKENLPQRISLPTYPFAKERYWITDAVTARKPIQEPKSEQIHPLVSHNISTLQQIGFNSLLSDKAYYAEDHKVNGVKIFPGSGFLEMASVSGNLAGEQKVSKIKEIVWMHPLSFQTGSKYVQTYLNQNGSGINYQISSLNEENERLVHAEGKIVLSKDSNHSTADLENVSIEHLKSQCSTVQQGSQYYDSFLRAGFQYGPSFQTIQEFHVSDTFALSRLELAAHLKSDFDKFVLHPSLLDGALQTVAGLLGNTNPDRPYLPFAIDELELVRPLTHSCYAYVEFADRDGNAPSDIKKFNIHLLNRKGAVLVKVKNFYARAFVEVAPVAQEA